VIEGVAGEEKVYQLGKALSSSFLLRGTHLAVVRKLASEHIVQIQLDLLSWLVKRLASLQQSEKDRGFRKALSLFRTLNPLLSALQSRDGLKMSVLYNKFGTPLILS
jgi:cohesin complex subunit SA-1/2